MFFNVQLKKFWGERGCLVERKQKFWPPNLPKQISNIKELWYPCMAIFSQPQKWENLAFTSTFMQSWNLPPLPDLVTDTYPYGPLASPCRLGHRPFRFQHHFSPQNKLETHSSWKIALYNQHSSCFFGWISLHWNCRSFEKIQYWLGDLELLLRKLWHTLPGLELGLHWATFGCFSDPICNWNPLWNMLAVFT